MATGVIRNFPLQPVASHCYPVIFPHSPCKDDNKSETVEVKETEGMGDVEDREVEEEGDEDGALELQEEEEEEECLDEVFLRSAYCSQDVTRQLLRFADVISRDVQRYFGHPEDQSACDIYCDSLSVTTSGCLRYYDDLLKIARDGSSDEQEGLMADVQQARLSQGSCSLGPLAALFDNCGPSQNRCRPMIRRHLPLSFWTEPVPRGSLVNLTHITNNDTASEGSTDTNTNVNSPIQQMLHYNTHVLDNTQPDFSDLLANWDPNPELPRTLTESTHVPTVQT